MIELLIIWPIITVIIIIFLKLVSEDPYSEGRKARTEGIWISDNPYKDFTNKWQLWNNGWHSEINRMH